MDKCLKFLICGALVLIYSIIGIPIDFRSWSAALVALTYHFFHVNVFHLLANVICFWQLSKRRLAKVKNLLIAFVIASIIPLIYSSPILGFSNVLYALTGLAWFSFSKKTKRIFFLVTIVMMFFPHIAGVPHLIALCAGIVIAYINNRIQRLDSDISAATY